MPQSQPPTPPSDRPSDRRQVSSSGRQPPLLTSTSASSGRSLVSLPPGPTLAPAQPPAATPSQEQLNLPALPAREPFRDYSRLMPRRVKKILLVSSQYDKFILEEDGQLTERVISDYLDLNLGYPPHIEGADSPERALEMLGAEPFDMVVTMLRVGTMDAFTLGGRVKAAHPELPVLVLAHNMVGLDELLETSDLSAVDGVFVWSGDASLMMALAKHVEDRMNVDHDTQIGDVRVIVLVEDSPYFYSTYLVLLYTDLMRQTVAVMSDSVNLAQRVLRRRTRAKVLLATTYEDAIDLCDHYRDYLLGVICDVRFPRNGEFDPDAGFRLLEHVRRQSPDLPVLLQSSDESNRALSHAGHASFVNKNDPRLLKRIHNFIYDNFGFGDFVFRMPDGKEVGRARTVREVVESLRTVPAASLEYHASRNHFSNWLRARTEFRLAAAVKPVSVSSFRDLEALRKWLLSTFEDLDLQKLQGEIVDFTPDTALRARFLVIGEGSLGGKARGLAFMNALIHRRDREPLVVDDLRVSLPRTAVIATDHFDDFVALNNLAEWMDAGQPDNQIAAAFLDGQLPPALERDLRSLVSQWPLVPLAVRSSSRLEDAMYRPFAGVYLTKMIPGNAPDPEVRFRQLANAVRLVYASTWFNDARDYLSATRVHRKHVEEEKMAVLIQEVAGTRHGDRFYPDVSGVARSFNYYAMSGSEPEDGVISLAFGLGKWVVDGEKSLSYSPPRPDVYPQFTSPRDWLQSQNRFWSIDLSPGDVPREEITREEIMRDTQFMTSEYVSEAETDGTLRFVASTYDVENNRLIDSIGAPGARVVTFAPILKDRAVPLNELLQLLLEEVEAAMNCAVEIEFAVTLDPQHGMPARFWLLQVRPLVVQDQRVAVEIGDAASDDDRLLCSSEYVLGNGVYDTLCDIVYVRPDGYTPANNPAIARELGEFNRELHAAGRSCVLIGFGRWGSSDPWLGIPVQWSQVSRALVMIESQLPNMVVDPSQGSHFFHNLTSFQVAYFTLHYSVNHRAVDFVWLDTCEAVRETSLVRHVRLPEPVHVRVDGRAGRGIIYKRSPFEPERPLPRDPRFAGDSGVWKSIRASEAGETPDP
ncbi:MAG: PEP/pyruvate-binding domain-containing protein [Planctomycetota bacterium]